jgi:ribose 5-phosphate isomerase B
MTMPRIAIASDHSGVAYKQAIGAWLAGRGHQVTDFGPFGTDSVDYPDFAVMVADAVRIEDADLGILICGTGIGMAIAANKMTGIRAANLTSVEFAQLARQHNAANIACLSARFVSLDDNLVIVQAFLATEPLDGRHALRVAKLDALGA